MSKIENFAKLTSKSQTTLPVAVRKALSVGPEDRIVFTILEGGKVEVRKAEQSDSDPVVRKYLAFLEADMLQTPQNLTPFSETLPPRDFSWTLKPKTST